MAGMQSVHTLIPGEAISLSLAFKRAADELVAHPSISLLVNESCTELAAETLAREIKDGLPEEWATPHFREKELNLFIRNEIDLGNLTALVRDPSTGEVLQMPRGTWLNSVLALNQVPTGIYDDFIFKEDDAHTPGPSSQIDGVIQEIFFWREDFLIWLENLLNPEKAEDEETNRPHPTLPDRQRAVFSCAQELWPMGIPVGLAVGTRDQRLISALKEKGIAAPSEVTIRRALRNFPRK